MTTNWFEALPAGLLAFSRWVPEDPGARVLGAASPGSIGSIYVQITLEFNQILTTCMKFICISMNVFPAARDKVYLN